MDMLKVSTPMETIAPTLRGEADRHSGYIVTHMVSGAFNLVSLPAVVISLSTPPTYYMSKEEHAAVDRAFFKSIKIVAGPRLG